MYVFSDLNEVLVLEPMQLMAESLLGERDKPKFSHFDTLMEIFIKKRM